MVYLLDINNTVVPSEWNNVVSKVKQFYLKNEDEVSLENINELVQVRYSLIRKYAKVIFNLEILNSLLDVY